MYKYSILSINTWFELLCNSWASAAAAAADSVANAAVALAVLASVAAAVAAANALEDMLAKYSIWSIKSWFVLP